MQSKQSAHNSLTHALMSLRGQHTTDDSKGAEKKLTEAVERVRQTLRAQGHTVEFLKEIPYWDIKMNYYNQGVGLPPTENDRRFTIRPDGGIVIVDGYIVGIFEDKFEGTADLPHNQDVKWKVGSTIDRTGKNLNVFKMYCEGQVIFPYVIFCHGCNFHPSNSMSIRLEQMNHGYPNRYVVVTPEDDGRFQYQTILDTITSSSLRLQGPRKLQVASIFVKTHSPRGPHAMGHGASDWTVEEYEKICLRVIETSLRAIKEYAP